MPMGEVASNFKRWLVKGFGKEGVIRCLTSGDLILLEVLIQGPPANDPAFVAQVKEQFSNIFVHQGWGGTAMGNVSVRIMSGDTQDGKPPAQMIVLPNLKVAEGAQINGRLGS
jgi:hypothetical protein